MDHGARLWVIRYARRNYFRVAPYYDLDDLIHEGYWQWYRVRQKYPNAVDTAHVMSIFKLAYSHRITILAREWTKERETLARMSEQDVVQEEEGTLAVMMFQAPPPVREIIRLFLTEDGRRKLMAPYRRRLGGTRETINERLCRLAGVDPESVNMPVLFKKHFGKL